MSNQNQESPISIEKAATLLKVSAKTLRRWEKKGILNPARTSGGHRRYLLTQVNDFKKNKGRGRLTQRVIKEKIQQFDTKLTPPVSVYRQNIIAADESGIQTPQSTYLENIIRDFDTPPATDHSPYRLYIIGFISLVVITLSLGVLGIKLSPDDKFSNLLSQVAVKIPFILSQQSDEPSVSNMPQKVLPKDFIGAVLAATSYANLDFKVNVPAIFAETIGANGGDITTTQTTFNLINTTATTLNVGGAATTVSLGGTSGVTSVNNTLNLTNNILTSAGDLTIDPTGGGVKIGTGIQNSVDLTGDDLFITGDLEVDGTSYIPTLSINGDAFTDLTGTGLQISSGALTATLGTSIDSSEISNDEIKEEDLKVSNSPSNTQLLTYNSSSGGFTWIDQSSATGGWTDGGTGIYVTTTTDSVTIGGTTELAKLGIDGDTNEIQLLVQGYSTQTANLVVFENSSGTDLFTFTNSGRLNFVDGGFLDLSAIVHDDSALQGLRLPQAASFTNLTSGEGVIAWDTDDDTLQVFNGTTWANVGGAFTLTADSGTNQTLSPGDTITLAGGTNGIDSVVGATDIVTFNLDTTEVGTTTWNAGATDPTWTFNTSGATDPTLAFANSSLTIGSAATIATDQTSLTLFDTTATTINFASAATTALNVGNGTGNYTAINIGSGIGTHVINIAGTGATAADTVNIGTGGTGADTINLGSSASTTALNLTSGTGAQTFASSVATGTTTTSAFVFTDNSLTTGTGGYVNSSSITQGNLFQIATATGADTLTSGNLLRISSDLANSTFTGNLAYIDWSPDGTTEIFNSSADLLHINAGQYANVGYLLNITDNGSAVFNVSQTAITSALPHSFTAAGDVSIAYDLLFTNQTASYIKSNAPLTIEAGESFESNNLTLKVYNAGGVVIDGSTSTNTSTGGVMDLNVSSTTTSNVGLNVDYTSASGVTAAADLFAAKINLVQNDTDGDLFGLWIDNNAVTTTIAGTNLVDCLLCLNNSENQAAAVLNAIYIASSGATAGSITNGINIATTDVTTDIILQNGETIDNNTDGTIALASSATSGNITTIGAISALTVAGSATPLRGTSIDLATNYTTADDDTTGLLITLDATTDSDATVDDLIGLSVTGSTVTVNGTSAAPVWRGVDIAIPDGTTTAGTSYTGDGIRLTTPTDTQSTALTTNYNGFNISSAGALTQDTLGGTINWRGVNLTMPNITQTTGTITADGVRVANGTITTGGTQSIFNAAAAGVGAGTLYGLNIGNITGGAGAETGINIGTGWDIGLQASSGIAVGSQQTLTANSTTPSVAGGSHWLTANTVATLISNFTNGTTGQILAIEVNDVNTDFDCTTSNLNCGSLDITTPTAQDLIYFIYDGTNWNLIEFIDTGSDQSGGADLAEYYVSSESLEVGEVVSIDPSEPLRIRKSGGSDDKNTIGIVSTNPGLVLSGPTDERTYPIALVGRVPVKISQNSLPVLIGDTISASNEPGKAQKATRAGFILGRALEAWSPDSGDDQIEVFVNLTWYDPTIYITGTGNIASTLNQPIPTYEQFFASDSVAFQALLSNLYVKFAENIKTATLEVAALISPSLKTNVISPLGTDLAIQLNDSVDGKDSQLLIQNQDSETVASIDSAGNATFSGELRVNKLVADEITSPTSLTLADVEALLKKAESDQNLLSDAQNWQVETATDSGTLNELALTNLYVTENAATKFLSVTDTLVVGPDLVIASSPTSQNSLNTLASPLELQSGAAQPLHLMAGLVTIDTDGNVVVGGNLTVVGEIASTGLNLHTSSESDNPDLLGIFDDQGEKVGGISASGSAQLTSLTTRTLSIPDDPAATTSATLAGLTLETGASAGKAKVLTGWSEITILQSKVNQNSLIFVTPTSHTSQPLYIKEQTNGSFVVGFDEAVSESVEFNWWIVELAKSL